MPASSERTKPRGSTRATVHHLGRLIVAGQMSYRPGQVISLEAVTKETGASRALAREALQILHQKRLVSLQARIGAIVRPVEQWDVFDPDVIAWRLDIVPRFQMRSLTELRQAIEPGAAYLAAQRASADVCRDLVSLSQQLRELGMNTMFENEDDAGEHHRDIYRRVDEEFHEALLKGSQNEMFYALADPVKLALNYRIKQDWELVTRPRNATAGMGGNRPFPRRPELVALWLHHGLAYAVEQGHPEAAEIFSRAILAEIRTAPLPELLCEALTRAINLLDPRGMNHKDWEQFERSVTDLTHRDKR
ncbi:MAG: FadR family transcriptional regulator [Pseudonocardiales bacterium]|nr:FadR family transcriptional regulator [Pseudonocardiales bacterium]